MTMNGTIGIRNAQGEGSTFFFDATFEVQQEQKRIVLNEDDIKNLRVLIV